MQETQVQFLGWEDLLEKGKATHFNILGLPCGSGGKESACHVETWVRSLGGEDSPGGRNGNPLQYSCLENPMDRVHGYSPWGCKEWDMTEVTEHAHTAQGTLLNTLNDLHGDRI